MGSVISIYSKDFFKEFILPAAQNADHVITLRSNYFQLENDVQVVLEVLDGVWRVKKTKQYSIIEENHAKDEAVLDENVALIIHTVYQDEIYLFTKKVDSFLHAYTKFSLAGITELTIGKDPSNDICYDFRKMVSRRHAILERNEDGFCIINQSQNGIYINSSSIMEKAQLEFGAFINILGLHMVYLGDVLAVDMQHTAAVVNEDVLHLQEKEGEATVFLQTGGAGASDKITYHRAPRNYEKLDSGKIEIEAPPEKEQAKKKSLFMTIGPSLSMSLPMLLGCVLMVYSNSTSGGGSSLYMYSGLVMSVSSAVVGVLWTILNLRQEKKESAEKEAYRFETYSRYLVEKTEEIKACYEDTIRRLHETYPDAMMCLSYSDKQGFLWNRNETHDDFMAHRLGVGNQAFQYEISVPKEKFTLYRDELADKPEYIRENYSTLVDVPITIDLLDKKLIGIVGGKKREGAVHIAKILTAQIAANNCYSDVKLAYIYDNETSEDFGNWEYAKWLPHVWSKDKGIRYVAAHKEEATDVFYELTRIFRERAELMGGGEKGYLQKPHYVVFVSNAEFLEGESFAKYAFDSDKQYGLTTIILTDRREALPNECEYIIENSEEFCGVYSVYESIHNRQKIDFDEIDDEKLNQFVRRMSAMRINEREEGGDIPNSLTFFEMFHINRIQDYPVREMWKKSKTYENIKGLLGHRAGGEPCYLDVHEKYHGPHGLVAGTTGSGKSETLQTYILSLAINYSPDDIGFFVIDYKGGGMANLFEGLPHMIGAISNLSGNQVKRAMISIKSENRRRQRVFTEHGVNNINLYTKLYKNGEAKQPIPHLFIIIDEFAELKREEPEFMQELISVAQVGRSLGVHLILATQKPSGTVNDNIWSNSKFRLCLRVQDQQDSKDMLHKPDAAYITQAGRGYLQVGNDEVYELFQSGFSGAVYDENMVSSASDVAKLITTSGKVEMTGNSVKLSQKQRAQELWIGTLCKMLALIIKTNWQTIKEFQDVESRLDYIIKRMYALMEKQKLNYDNNDYNTSRLADFINLYLSAPNTSALSERVEAVIQLATKERKKLPQAKEKTQLDITIEYLSEVAKKNGYNHKQALWLPILRDHIYLNDFSEYRGTCFQNDHWIAGGEDWNLKILLGQVDDPENQNQMPLFLDFAKQGHVAVIGSVVSGKSTLLQTMLYGLIQKFTPSDVNIYILDFSSRMLTAFEKAPHIGGMMYEGDADRIKKFFNMLQNITEERKELFKGGNYRQYVKKNGTLLPAIIIFIDNYASFKEKTNEKYEEQMIRLSKEGVGLGIYLVVSGGGIGYNDITSRVAENVETTYCLTMQNDASYGEILHTVHVDVKPENDIKGRGLVWFDSRILEFQAALAVEAENDYQRMEKIEAVCEKFLKCWSGASARRIPEIPEKPTWSVFEKLMTYQNMSKDKDRLPVAYDEMSADVYGISLREIYCYLITGGGRTGKTNYMKVMLQSALDKGAHVCVLDSPKRDMRIYEKNTSVHYLTEEEGIFTYLRTILTPVFQERNEIKNHMLAEEKDEQEIYEYMREKQPYFIFIPDFVWFVNLVYTSGKNMSGFMETLIAKGRYHNIYFVAEIAIGKLSSVKGYKLYESFVEYQMGVHFGGKSNSNGIMPFEYLSYKEREETDPVGVGTLPGVSSYTGTRKIVVPVARK